MILAVKTDAKEAHITLMSVDGQILQEKKWLAHRQLSVDIHVVIDELLDAVGKTKQDIAGVVAFKGPGSFTGLRIGLSVANAISYGLEIPVVATNGDSWLEAGREQLKTAGPKTIVLPEYGGEPNITKPRK